MTFNEVCIKYHITPNLKDHLLEVASLTQLICRNWKQVPPFEVDKAIKCALIHDVGNMSKSKPGTLHMYMPQLSVSEIEHWEKEVNLFQRIYGTDDHYATKLILDELGLSKEVKEAVELKSFEHIKETVESSNWLLKLISYADLRINPDGLVTMKERLLYIKTRYPKYSERPDFEEMYSAALILEKQIQSHTDLNLNKLEESSLLMPEELKILADTEV